MFSLIRRTFTKKFSSNKSWRFEISFSINYAQIFQKAAQNSNVATGSDPDHWLVFDRFFLMMDHFKKSKNLIDRLIKIEKSINRSQNIYQAQAIKRLKKNRTSFFYLLFIVTGHSLIFYCYSVPVTLRAVKTIEENRKKIRKNQKKIGKNRSFNHSKIEWSKIDDRNSMIKKKIDCFPTDQSKKIDHRFLIGITSHGFSPDEPVLTIRPCSSEMLLIQRCDYTCTTCRVMNISRVASSLLGRLYTYRETEGSAREMCKTKRV